MNKIKLLWVIFFICPYFFFAQNDFNKKLNELASQLATKLSEKGKTKIAVWDFTDLDGNINNLGKYVSETLSVYLTNATGNIKVVDRNHLNTILKEHQLKSDGFIDVKTAKQLGKIIQVGAIVTGKITVFRNAINLTMKVLDTETADIIAASANDLPLNDNLRDILGIPSNSPNRGFNRPLNSNESYNNPTTVNSDCIEKKTGDYCFFNNTNITVRVHLDQRYSRLYITLKPKQTQCFYDMNAKSRNYYVVNHKEYFTRAKVLQSGQINIEQCKSKTFKIN